MSGSGSSGMILVAVVAAETGTLGWTKVGAIAAAIAGRRIVSRNGEITRGAGRGSSTGDGTGLCRNRRRGTNPELSADSD
ncbi:hypothetical protein PC128_g5349 [Phytophthora cactorum]|nr:hypothetical protein PC128_g5349 [Phytophthora cactorum]